LDHDIKLAHCKPQDFEMEVIPAAADWEAIYAPYDQPTYQAVLDQIKSDDVILDIGAGDLRLTRQIARIAQKVYAIEINAQVLGRANRLPANLIPIHADARALDFPSDLTAGVLMMRHCTCFGLYAAKLQNAGATRCITNARWHMNVEVVHLLAQRIAFAEAGMGWYACFCGGTGFKEGNAEHWSMEMDRITNEVYDCPQCRVADHE
jgi:SAM-dependent methyltransferase